MARRSSRAEPPPPPRARFEAVAFDETGRRITVGKYPERWQAERAATAKSLQRGFHHGQVFDIEGPK